MSWSSAASSSANTTLGIVKYFIGNSKEKKARKALEKLKQPMYDIQDEYYQNANAANALAQGGLPTATKDYFTTQSEKGLGAGIQGILAGGGSPNDVSKIFQTYEDSIAKVSAADAQNHIENIRYWMGVNKDLAGQKTTQWALNKYQPYLNNLRQLNDAQKAGEAIKASAYDDVRGAISSFGASAGGSSMGGGGKKGGGGGGSSSVAALQGANSGVSEGFNFGRSGMDSSSPSDRASSDYFGTPGIPTNDPFGNDNQDYQDFLNWKQQRRGRI